MSRQHHGPKEHDELFDSYKSFLQATGDSVRSRLPPNGSALLVNLGPAWSLQAPDVFNEWALAWGQSMREKADCAWETPAGLGLCPLDVLSALCAAVHDHLARSHSNVVVSGVIGRHLAIDPGVHLGASLHRGGSGGCIWGVQDLVRPLRPRRSPPPPQPSTPLFWQQLYRHRRTHGGGVT